ncbi:MAG: hypothetical protein KDE26_22900 [Bacteroidetes bacterium]|nr:hypothetical protein [Bacteroidota bacterium]MCB0846126.1 hypothetical protein [Bacteroidota bacterium]
MRKILIILAILIGLGSTKSYAQLADKLVPHMGFMWEFATIKDVPTSSPQIFNSFYNFHLGTYYTLMHHNDIFSLGVDASAQFGLNFQQYVNASRTQVFTRVDYMAQLPVFVMGKVGATATPYNQQKIGIAGGIGGNYNYLSYNNNFNQKSKSSYFVPSFVVEGTLLSRGNPLTVRFHYGLAHPETNQKTTARDGSFPPVTNRFLLGNFGIGILYGI